MAEMPALKIFLSILNSYYMKQFIFIFLLLITMLQTYALRVEFGNDIIIDRPVYEDLYISGGGVTINAPVYGDLIIAGGTVTVNDSVSNDILVIGGTVRINGYTGDDIRCAGGEIHILESIGGDLVVAGGKIEIGKSATVNGSQFISGGDVVIDGIIKGKMNTIGGNITFNGVAENAIDCRGGNLTMNGRVMGPAVLTGNKLVLGNRAVFNQDVRYWNGAGRTNFQPQLKKGTATFDLTLQPQTGHWYFLGLTTFFMVIWYTGTVLLMILILQYLFRNILKRSGDTLFSHALKSLGYGVLFFVGVPVLAVIAFLSLIGLPLGFILLFFYFMALLLTTVITSLVAANWLNNRYNYNWSFRKIIFAAFGIFIIFKLISLTPFLGGLIMIILACTAFGAILLNVNFHRRKAAPAM
jgi:hypothetical protein